MNTVQQNPTKMKQDKDQKYYAKHNVKLTVEIGLSVGLGVGEAVHPS